MTARPTENMRDVLARTFADPPAEYGPVDGYWWEGGRLDREKLRWQLTELKEKGVSGTWFYARFLEGEPLGSDPAYLTDEWWEFIRFAAEEQRRLGLINWFSSWVALQLEQNAVRAQRPRRTGLWGRRLVSYEAVPDRDGVITIGVIDGDDILDIAAYRRAGDVLDVGSRVDLRAALKEGVVSWMPPDREWIGVVVAARPWDLDYLNPEIAARWNDVILGEYQRRMPDLIGSGVQAFGPDEMRLLNGQTIYAPALIDRIQSTYGYVPTPYLAGLFHDVGPKTEQIRSNYRRAMTELLDENFYRANSRWLHERGMKHVSLSQLNQDLITHTFHYGDFFRYLRSFDIPGNEDPHTAEPGQRRLLRTKMSSSVARLYGRQRAVLCAHYASGWGQTLDQNVTWTLEAYAKGLNLYNRHLIPYSLMGGWYEYVPPADHFYQPVWTYWKSFTDYVRRLSYIMSQGENRADVALLYPLATLHAHWRVAPVDDERGTGPENAGDGLFSGSGEETFDKDATRAAEAVEELIEVIYRRGIDVNIVDDDSFDRAQVSGAVLSVSGVEFRSVVIPAMTTVRQATMRKIKEFYDAGGTVIAFGRLPYASDERGRDDPELRALLTEMFHVEGCRGQFVAGPATTIPDLLAHAIDLDVVASGGDLFHTHQRVGDVDVYLFFNVCAEERDVTVDLRATGRPEIWDPFTGEIRRVYRTRRKGNRTEVRLRMRSHEGVVLVLAPDDKNLPSLLADNLTEIIAVSGSDDHLVVEGFDADGGRKQVRLGDGAAGVLTAQVVPPPEPIEVSGPFSFQLQPTMDNRWGDFRYPASEVMIGPEARRFRYREEPGPAGAALGWNRPDFDDSDWAESTYSYGPSWLHLGPLRADAEPADLAARAARGDPDLDWEPYEFSWTYGSARRARREGTLGWFQHLLGVSDNFLVLDEMAVCDQDHHHYLYTIVRVAAAGTYSVRVGRRPDHAELTGYDPDADTPYAVAPGTEVSVDGVRVLTVGGDGAPEVAVDVDLQTGAHRVLVRLAHVAGQHTTGYVVILGDQPPEHDPRVPVLSWSERPRGLVYDVKAEGESRVGWYRFEAPPGLRQVRMSVDAAEVEVWIDGEPHTVHDGLIRLPAPRAGVSTVAVRVHQHPGVYGGAVFTEPVAFDCEAGLIEAGDWSRAGLASYSGIGVYETSFSLGQEHLGHRTILDLGQVRTVAEVFVNGEAAGVKIVNPFVVDITDLVRAGDNSLTVKVANTLANHMSTSPSRWVLEGQTVSGLLGPVRITFLSPVRLEGRIAP